MRKVGDIVGYILPGISSNGDKRGKKKGGGQTVAFAFVLATKTLQSKEYLILEIHTINGIEIAHNIPEDQTKRTADTWHNRP